MGGRKESIGRTLRMALLGVAALVCNAPTANAQRNARITSRSIVGYVEVLGLELEQTEIVFALHGEYTTDIEAVANRRQNA